MCTLVQLEDGSYRLIVDYKDGGGFSIHLEYDFVKSERSEAEVEKTVFSIQMPN